MTVLLVGATGQLGGRIARELLSRRTTVRALCRPASGPGSLRRMGAEIAIGDLTDAASLSAACRGADIVITTANAVGRAGADNIEDVDRRGTRNLIDAARAAGVRQFVYVSAFGADEHSPVPLMAAKGSSERYLRESGLSWTVLAPNLFMESWVGRVVGTPVREGQPVTIVGEGRTRHTFVAEHDVAMFAAAVVDSPAAAGRHLAIGGPQALSWRDVIATYESVLGRAVDVRFVAPGEAVSGIAPAVVPLLASLDRFETSFDTSALATEFGVRQTPLEAWVRASLATPRRVV